MVIGRVRSLVGLVAAVVIAAPLVGGSAGYVQAQDGEVSIVAAGLTNPRGFAWGGDGTLFVAEGGTGGTTAATPDAPAPLGPITGGKTASVSWISDGCPVMFADGLPSSITATGEASGAADVAILDGTLYVLITGGGASHGNPDVASGLYTIGGSGGLTLVADLGRWLRDNPVANVPAADYDPEGSYFDLAAASDGSALWVVEANSQQLLSVTPKGEVTRVADLSGDNQVPTTVATGPNGSVYVGYLSGAPFPNGGAKVVEVAPEGTVTPVWTGLTTVTGIAVAEDGKLLALEMSTGNTDSPPFFVPNSGKIVRQTGLGSAEDVVTDLNLPTHLMIGPDGAYYVASPAIGANEGGGLILRIDPTADGPVSAGNVAPPPGSCGAGLPPTETPPPPATPAAKEVAVAIYDFGFDAPMIEIPVGTTVTWTNTGEVEHTTVSFDQGKKVWDSDIMEPGDVYSFTFDKAGTYDYLCGLHPTMKATIVVSA